MPWPSMIGVQESKYEIGGWVYVDNVRGLSTAIYDTQEEALEASQNGIFTETTLAVQKKIESIHDLNNDGCISLIIAIYDNARAEYLDEYKIKAKTKVPVNPNKINEIEDFFRNGYYTLYKPGEPAVRELRAWKDRELEKIVAYEELSDEEKEEQKKKRRRDYEREYKARVRKRKVRRYNKPTDGGSL